MGSGQLPMEAFMGSGQLPIEVLMVLGHQPMRAFMGSGQLPMEARADAERTVGVALTSWVMVDMTFLLTEL
jgi:hypothetical protein